MTLGASPHMAPGGLLLMQYVDATMGERHRFEMHVAHFDPTTLAYTNDGAKVPSESTVADTYAALGALWAAYYPATWTLQLLALYYNDGGSFSLAPVQPTTAPVSGANGAASVAGPCVRRFYLCRSRANKERTVRLHQMPGTVIGTTADLSATGGGIDERDVALLAYLSGAASGAVCPDGFAFLDHARVWLSDDRPLAPPPFDVGAQGIVPTPCLYFASHGATICNDAPELLRFRTPHAQHGVDLTGYQLPAGHRVDSVPGLGTPVWRRVWSSLLDVHVRVLSLWSPGGNAAPPPGWDLPPPETSWSTANLGDATIPFLPPAQIVWTAHVANSTQQIIARDEFTLPAGTVVSAHLQCAVNDAFLAIHINGVALAFSGLEAALATGMDIDPAPFIANGDNVLAFWVSSSTVTADASNSGITWNLIVTVVPPEEKLRLSHATHGDQMLFPLITLGAAPDVLMAKDPDSGLPAFSPAPTITAIALGGGGGIQPAPPTQCVQVRCGVSAVLRDHLMSLYDDWRGWLDPFFQACATLGVAAAVATVPWDWIADLGLAAAGDAIKGIIVTLTQGFVGAITGNLLPPLDPDMKTRIQQAAFDALSCTDDQVQVSAAAITAWQATLAALATWPLASLAGPFCGVLLQFTPLAAWQGAAATASPSHVCDLWP